MSDDDDFYGNDNDTDQLAYLSNKESDRQVQQIFPIGYQDGLEIGKEITLQRGFNEGFIQGSTVAYRWSQLLGLISSLDVFFHHNKQYVPENVDSSILESLVEKINSIIKDKCSPPSIDDLKFRFINFQEEKENVVVNTTATSSCCSKDGNNSTNGCCKDDNNDKTACCSSGIDINSLKLNDNGQDQDDDDQCCGGGSDKEGCCKSSSSSTTTKATPPAIAKEPYQITLNQIQDALFHQIAKECVMTITKMGLDGEQLLQDCLKSTHRVSMN
ncbi:hypothetical protein CYY_005604 [Polysphondylium violaceum]|uniref:Essential protein Yae1 N-terminal domain-containing protein n=1 Tax=Polysphondylium violaceum TaxID=133409 RepID=A0A8J4UZH8_9MYCE|nr:hypothetical protein CYY_005604 [Polysphondylium violaceum]